MYPFDVNSALVPASLRATQALLEAGLLNFTGLDAGEVGDVAGVWEAQAAGLFEVQVAEDVAESRLRNFVRAANLSEALLRGPGGNVSFYALSLKEDDAPVEVLNSDLGFNLLYGANVSRVFLQHVVDALQPYPRGMYAASHYLCSAVLRKALQGCSRTSAWSSQTLLTTRTPPT